MIATPGRLVQVLQSRPKADVIKKLSHLQYLVLDEVDQFTTGSENFNKDIGTILEYLPAPDKRQTILTTASLTIELGELLKNSRFHVELAEQKMPKNLEFSYLVVPQYFYCEAYLSMLIEKITGFQIIFSSEMAKTESSVQNPSFKQAIIFTRNVEQCELINRMLLDYGFASTCLHSQLKMEQRIQNINSFRSQQSAFLVATDVASRGLDIPTVQIVINTNMPSTIEDFQHRAGRCARRQKNGKVICLIEPSDFLRLEAIEKRLDIQVNKLIQIEDWTKNGQMFEINDEQVVRTYFGKVVGAQRRAKIDMLDQDIGFRI